MEPISFRTFTTPWGHFGYVTRADRVVSTFLPQPLPSILGRIARDYPTARPSRHPLAELERDVSRYFQGARVALKVQIDLNEQPAFHRAVLEACRRIPYGQTASYADLARSAGNAKAVRAAGGAMARNPLPLIIPCHRVLRSDGSIGGFSSTFGIAEKLRLLRLEGVEGLYESGVPMRRAV